MRWPGRLLPFAAVATLATAAILATSVIPSVRADTFPGAMPERAVPAFWVNVILNLLVAAQAFGSSRRRAGGPTRRRGWTAAAGVVAALLGLALIDAAIAFAEHGPTMQGVIVALWVSVCLDLAAGVAMIVSAFVRRTTSLGQD